MALVLAGRLPDVHRWITEDRPSRAQPAPVTSPLETVFTALPLVQAFRTQDFFIGIREAVKHPKAPPFLEDLPTPRQLYRIGPGFHAGLSMHFSNSSSRGIDHTSESWTAMLSSAIRCSACSANSTASTACLSSSTCHSRQPMGAAWLPMASDSRHVARSGSSVRRRMVSRSDPGFHPPSAPLPHSAFKAIRSGRCAKPASTNQSTFAGSGTSPASMAAKNETISTVSKSSRIRFANS